MVLLTVENIRREYPSPRGAGDMAGPLLVTGSCYCVLGAACEFAWKYDLVRGSRPSLFPNAHFAATYLGIPERAARDIAFLNDAGRLDMAWDLLDKTLLAKATR